MKKEIDQTVERIGQLQREPNKCPDCGFEPLDYSDDDVITCWRCDAQDYKRMYDKEFAARMKLKADLATALNEADALRAVLIECRDKWDSADNGRCTSCDFGYRKFDTKSNVQECDNAECLSHRIRAAIKPKEDK